ncbi:MULTISPECIES: FadR/GntR family transcriptional regulator [Actinomadura]|uniref:DNA-binding transcriptional regulator, FadR family n=1 Tax=Actinomadura madurae TaxID=1993 RepID=A0A1I5NLU2_9ACTN|nr:FadR/GntR family transcriptional regulator [Actinomadura madurae]SFP22286.1 DNA-binding transcriptional regulator, FadR family [Actinomadura madurae]
MAGIRPTTVRVPKAGEMVAAQLRRQIVTGELKEGDGLPSENTLMQQFGVSRPTLREAFRILESEQIIQIRRGARGGAHVLVPDPRTAGRYAGTLLQYRGTTLADVYAARTALEASGVEFLARRRSAADLKTLGKALAQGEQLLEDPIAFSEQADLQFHRLLMELSGNQTMIVLLDMLYAIIEQHNQSVINANRDSANAGPSVQLVQKAHAKVVDLIRQKDVDKAVAHWRRHLTQVSEFVLAGPAETVLDVLS